MHALNRADHAMPIIRANYLRHELGSQASMPCILIAPSSLSPLLMARLDEGRRFPGDRPRWSASSRNHSDIWLRNAAAGLCLLAAAAAVVSFTAQYQLVYATRQLAVVAGLEATIPDAAALVFACLGIALALHGRRAVRARILNLASVGTSVFMNTIAAAPGWRNLAVWAMPPVAYALASDTLIRRPGGGARPPAGPGRHDGRGGADAAGRGRRAGVVAAAPGPGPGLHPGRVPRLGGGGVPGRPRPPPGPRVRAGPRRTRPGPRRR